MRAWWVIVRKELELYFVTPVAYVSIAVFWAASGFFFSFNALFVSAVEMVTAFHNMSLLLMLMLPLMSMRCFAEERQSDTYELLQSLPVGDGVVVAAKFCALLFVVLLMLTGSGGAVLVLMLYAEPDLGPIVGGYAGVLLLAAAFSGIGVFLSSLARSQLVAAVLTWGVLLFLWFVDYTTALVPASLLVPWIQHLSFSVQYLDLIRGVITLSASACFLSVAAISLVAATQWLKWSRS